MEKYEDKEITCPCGSTFVFEAGEQKYFADKGLVAPRYCKNCRIERKKRFEKGPVATSFFAVGAKERDENSSKRKSDREILES